jgi:hypothetical protein
VLRRLGGRGHVDSRRAWGERMKRGWIPVRSAMRMEFDKSCRRNYELSYQNQWFTSLNHTGLVDSSREYLP